MRSYCVVVEATEDPGWFTARVVAAGGQVGGVEDRLDLTDRQARRRAARWLSATSGAPYEGVLDGLDAAYVRDVVRTEIELGGIDRSWAA